jgi:hypothetical protein
VNSPDWPDVLLALRHLAASPQLLQSPLAQCPGPWAQHGLSLPNSTGTSPADAGGSERGSDLPGVTQQARGHREEGWGWKAAPVSSPQAPAWVIIAQLPQAPLTQCAAVTQRGPWAPGLEEVGVGGGGGGKGLGPQVRGAKRKKLGVWGEEAAMCLRFPDWKTDGLWLYGMTTRHGNSK